MLDALSEFSLPLLPRAFLRAKRKYLAEAAAGGQNRGSPAADSKQCVLRGFQDGGGGFFPQQEGRRRPLFSARAWFVKMGRWDFLPPCGESGQQRKPDEWLGCAHAALSSSDARSPSKRSRSSTRGGGRRMGGLRRRREEGRFDGSWGVGGVGTILDGREENRSGRFECRNLPAPLAIDHSYARRSTYS